MSRPAVDWNRLQDLFRAASALPDDQRRQLLGDRQRVSDETALRLRRLLDAHTRSGLLDASAIALDDEASAGACEPDRSLVGRQIGRYRVLRVLGCGGMATVYEAQQDHPTRTVALKVLRSGAASAASLRRFEFEAEVLARLHHPSIAPIFEAGTFPSDEGPRPYFAMELIDGLPLPDFVREHRPDRRALLTLLIGICDGIDHAHQRGVIHRDLKPGNILVNATEQAKILDFGIARLADAAGVTLQTGAGQLLGTIRYMSPEQIGGDPAQIDRRTDVYALGVIGYELLTGRMPQPGLDAATIIESVRLIRDVDPEPMSRIDRSFRGDLETIFAKALEKERDRRYSSASALAEDLRRFLADEPILARPATTFYQLRKFARRNRVLVGGAAAAVAALMLGVVTTTWQWRQTMHERNNAQDALGRAVDAEKLASARLDHAIDGAFAMMDLADHQLADLPGGTPARESFADRALASLLAITPEDAIEKERNPRMLYALGYAYQRVAQVQLIMGRTAEALANAERAMAVRRQHVEVVPQDVAGALALPVGHWKLAEGMMQLGRFDDALAENRAALALNEAIYPDASSDTINRAVYLGSSHRRVAESAAAAGQLQLAEMEFRAAIEFAQGGLALEPAHVVMLRTRAMALLALAQVLARTDRSGEAERLLRDSRAIIEPHLADPSRADVFAMLHAARCDTAMSELDRGAGRLEFALAASAAALARAQAISIADPANVEARAVEAVARLAHADSLRGAGRLDDARAAASAALAQLTALAALDPDHWQIRQLLEQARSTFTSLDAGR